MDVCGYVLIPILEAMIAYKVTQGLYPRFMTLWPITPVSLEETVVWAVIYVSALIADRTRDCRTTWAELFVYLFQKRSGTRSLRTPVSSC
jgi:hypothetical protein